MARPKTGYRLADGTRVDGVTTVLNRWKDAGGLLYWACDQGKAIERGEIAHLYDKRDEAADIGTIAHEMCDAYLKGKDPWKVCEELSKTPEAAAKATQAYRMFLHWWETNGLEVHASEIPLVSEKYRFGGTPDWILKIRDGLAIGDIKTSNAIYRDMLMQVAAYKQLWEENHPDEPITGGFYVCRFSKEYPDWEQRYFGELDVAWREFQLLVEAYELDKQLKKRVA